MIKTSLFLEQALIVTGIFSFVLSLICFCAGAIPNGFILLIIFVINLGLAKRFFPEGFTDTILLEELETYVCNNFNDYKFSSKSLNRSFNANRVFWSLISQVAKANTNKSFKVHIRIAKCDTDNRYYEQIEFDCNDNDLLKLLNKEVKPMFKSRAIELNKDYVID